jgi:hypothetical protein
MGQAGVASGAEAVAAAEFVEAFALQLMVGHQSGGDDHDKANEESKHLGFSTASFLPFLTPMLHCTKSFMQGLSAV